MCELITHGRCLSSNFWSQWYQFCSAAGPHLLRYDTDRQTVMRSLQMARTEARDRQTEHSAIAIYSRHCCYCRLI